MDKLKLAQSRLASAQAKAEIAKSIRKSNPGSKVAGKQWAGAGIHDADQAKKHLDSIKEGKRWAAFKKAFKNEWPDGKFNRKDGYAAAGYTAAGAAAGAGTALAVGFNPVAGAALGATSYLYDKLKAYRKARHSMKETIEVQKDLVNAILADKLGDAQSAFNDLVNRKLEDKREELKIEVANNIAHGDDEDETEETEVEEDDIEFDLSELTPEELEALEQMTDDEIEQILSGLETPESDESEEATEPEADPTVHEEDTSRELSELSRKTLASYVHGSVRHQHDLKSQSKDVDAAVQASHDYDSKSWRFSKSSDRDASSQLRKRAYDHQVSIDKKIGNRSSGMYRALGRLGSDSGTGPAPKKATAPAKKKGK
jgi:hypothetical protein